MDAAAIQSRQPHRDGLALAHPVTANSGAIARPRVAGKFLFAGGDKLWIKGVTYGPFRPDAAGGEYPASERLNADHDPQAMQPCCIQQ